MKIEIDPQELDKLLNTFVALKTRMLERNVKSVNTKNGKVNYNESYDKPLLHHCDNCAYSSLSKNEGPCYTCGIEEGRYDNWKERTETE